MGSGLRTSLVVLGAVETTGEDGVPSGRSCGLVLKGPDLLLQTDE